MATPKESFSIQELVNITGWFITKAVSYKPTLTSSNLSHAIIQNYLVTRLSTAHNYYSQQLLETE